MSLKDIKVGDTVMRRDANEGRMGSLKGPRVVTKVGRKYLFIEDDECGYDRETGRRNDHYGHGHLQTMEEYDVSERLLVAEKALREMGVEFSYRCQIVPARRLKVAEIILAELGT